MGASVELVGVHVHEQSTEKAQMQQLKCSALTDLVSVSHPNVHVVTWLSTVVVNCGLCTHVAV